VPLLCQEGFQRRSWLLCFQSLRLLSELAQLRGEQGGVEVASALESPGIDDQVGQGVESAHRVDVAYLGPLDAQGFGLTVDAFSTGAALA
jgi:hypothetical protein